MELYQEYVEALEMLDDDLRFEYIIDLGKAAPEKPFPEDFMRDENLMHGCMSRVWIIHTVEGNKHNFSGESDAVIVKGLVSMMTRSFSGLTADELAGITLDHVRKLNLGALTTQRQVGMMAMLKHMQKLAAV
ncbi:SufE family protein [Alphaproteobacteria bacterium]|nr:SufE family protein [Alphaproteobacteria bacterium]